MGHFTQEEKSKAQVTLSGNNGYDRQNYYKSYKYGSPKKCDGLLLDAIKIPLIDFKSHPLIHATSLIRPFHGIGCDCMPNIKKSLTSPLTYKLGLRNMLTYPINYGTGCISKQFAFLSHCLQIDVPECHFNKVNKKSLLKDDTVRETIEHSLSSHENFVSDKILLKKYQNEAIQIFNNMKASISRTLIRFVGYVLYKVFDSIFTSVIVTEGQLRMIDDASTRNVPLVLVPLHRSHVDYLFVTWILFNRRIAAPIVAAGDNLRIPVFGWLLRGLGGFFIRRKLDRKDDVKKDIYRSVLHAYVTQSLRSGSNLEFFIEGRRTRSGKPCLAKAGILSVVVDSFLSGSLDDALIVPVAINYDRILDGNFVKEQLGEKKMPESFWRAVIWIFKVLSTNYGHARIDFCQPFSIREFFQSVDPSIKSVLLSKGSNNACITANAKSPAAEHRCNDAVTLHQTNSNSSLLSVEVSNEYRVFVRDLASHIIFDAERSLAIMSTNAVSWLLCFAHRHGVTLKELSSSFRLLRDELTANGRDFGFSGDCTEVVRHGVKMLGLALISVDGDIENDPMEKVFVKPITTLPSIIELNYYANVLVPQFVLDSVVATCLMTMLGSDLIAYIDIESEFVVNEIKLIRRCVDLCKILRDEFVFVAPCSDLEAKIRDSIHTFVVSGFLKMENSTKRRTYHIDLDIDEEDEEEIYGDAHATTYRIHATRNNIKKVHRDARSIAPIIESYYATTLCLNSLIDEPSFDLQFLALVQKFIKTYLTKGLFLYGECIAAETITNAMKSLESDGVIESYRQDNCRILYLKNADDEKLSEIQRFYSEFRFKS